MDTTDRGSEFVSPFESVIVTQVLQEQDGGDPHAEINARRSSVEDPEMLRHLRSL